MADFNKCDFKKKRTIVQDEYFHQRPIALFKNQRLCVTRKPNYKGIGESFLQIGSEEWHYAFRTLSKSALGLWLYSMENTNGYGFALVPSYVCKNLGFKSEKTYHNAKKELIEKGFWIDKSDEGVDYKETICLAFPEMDVDWCNETHKSGYEHDGDMDIYPWYADHYDEDYGVSYEQNAWDRGW